MFARPASEIAPNGTLILKQGGFKFGRWLDLAFYQLTLETPLAPLDG